jgi:hypothetical protein
VLLVGALQISAIGLLCTCFIAKTAQKQVVCVCVGAGANAVLLDGALGPC